MITALQTVTELVFGNDRGNISKEEFLCQPNGRLPDTVVVYLDQCKDLYKPTVLAKVKMDPYVGVYLVSKKTWRVCTSPKTFGGANPKIDKEVKLPFEGEPLVVVQVFAKEPIRDEFIGECPLDLLPILNSPSRSWHGPITIYGNRGTTVRGVVILTVSLTGGTPFDPHYPACTVAQSRQRHVFGRHMGGGGGDFRGNAPYGPTRQQKQAPSFPFCC
eukprot:Gregarina_sp_Poly_1__9541@NODE_600_length_7248_cov_149_324885_g463_i0_p5_GENE_NODE_600_length_7248_cov_149_324885_g463_i0NODE_600_length_7248_cov_149_324885_g463_i0_p5_ORF_typecomplete_len217_score10_76C2/PF00168_30/1_7e07_NODE_600_length_7248_cov_149_324885_g463_i054606110